MYLAAKERIKSNTCCREQYVAYAILRGKSPEFIDKFDNVSTRPSPDRIKAYLRRFMEVPGA
jgi:hypothetical protein